MTVIFCLGLLSLQNTFTKADWNFTMTWQSSCYYPHFVCEEMESLGPEGTWPRAHSLHGVPTDDYSHNPPNTIPREVMPRAPHTGSGTE